MAEFKILELIPEGLRPKLIEEVQEILTAEANKKEKEKEKRKATDEEVNEVIKNIMN